MCGNLEGLGKEEETKGDQTPGEVAHKDSLASFEKTGEGRVDAEPRLSQCVP